MPQQQGAKGNPAHKRMANTKRKANRERSWAQGQIRKEVNRRKNDIRHAGIPWATAKALRFEMRHDMGDRGLQGFSKEPFLLGCNHTRVYPSPLPSIGDEVFCPQCQQATRIISHAYNCHCIDCTVMKGFGVDKEGMEHFAYKHARTYTHRVQLVGLDGRVYKTAKANDEQPTLPGYIATKIRS